MERQNNHSRSVLTYIKVFWPSILLTFTFSTPQLLVLFAKFKRNDITLRKGEVALTDDGRMERWRMRV